MQELEILLEMKSDEVDPKLRKTALKIEYEYLQYDNHPVPAVMTDSMWERVEKEEKANQRRSLYKYFFLKERYKFNDQKKKKEREENRRQMNIAKERLETENLTEATMGDASGRLSMFLRRNDAAHIKKSHNFHLNFALSLGQPLVFDLGIPYTMKGSEVSSFHRQMRDIYSFNRAQWEPFNIHLCNYDAANPIMHELVEGHTSSHFLWNSTPACFTDVFPHERLVYLTPDAAEVVDGYNHDDVFVIGAVVDRIGSNTKMTLSKVKELGIRSARFDVDRYFRKKKAPLMTLDVVYNILMDARDTDGNWLYGYRNLPKRMVEWRPQYNFMNDIPRINEPNESRLYKNHRSIFKPRRTEMPYSLGGEDESQADSEL